MKNVQQILKRYAGIIGMICLAAALFSSCRRDRVDYIVNPNNQPAAMLSVINASPDSPPLAFFLNQNQVTGSPLRYGNGLDYISAYTGKRTAIFYNQSTQQKILSDTISLKVNTFYSLYIANLIAKPDAILLTDSISKPASGMATVRFVNVSSDAPAVDLGIKSGALIASNKTYKGFTSFIPVKSNVNDTLEIRSAGTSTVLVSLSNIKFQSGSVYTVWLHGLAAATDNSRISLDIQRNAFY